MERLYSCVTVSLRCDDRPHRTLPSSERHHPVINDAEDVPPALFARIGIRMAGKTLCRALAYFGQLAVEAFLDKDDAASAGLIHNKPQSATS
jgi:hypothetical protein